MEKIKIKNLNNPFSILETINKIGYQLKLNKFLIEKGEKTSLLLYKGGFNKKIPPPAIFDFEFSFKFDIHKKQIIPALRFTNYCFYNQDYPASPLAIKEIQAIRIEAIKKVFRHLRLYSQDNENLLDVLCGITFDNNYILPIQFAIDLNEKECILKAYYWCDEKYKMPQTERRRILEKIISRFFFIKNNRNFFKEKNIFFFSIDFNGKDIGMKVYLLYKGYKRLFNDLQRFNFRREMFNLFKKFITQNKKYFDNEPVLCFSVMKGKLSIKKIEIFIKKEFRNKPGYTNKITKAFLSYFCSPESASIILGKSLIKDIYVYSVGENFITIYSRFKIWNFPQ